VDSARTICNLQLGRIIFKTLWKRLLLEKSNKNIDDPGTD